MSELRDAEQSGVSDFGDGEARKWALLNPCYTEPVSTCPVRRWRWSLVSVAVIIAFLLGRQTMAR